MKFKPGVPADTLDNIMYVALDIMELIYKSELEMVITSTSDGKHMKNSLHYAKPKAKAVDIRTRYLSDSCKQAILKKAKKCLPIAFEIVLEKDHFHIELDSKNA